jgi:hypothetical protein
MTLREYRAPGAFTPIKIGEPSPPSVGRVGAEARQPGSAAPQPVSPSVRMMTMRFVGGLVKLVHQPVFSRDESALQNCGRELAHG